jgi:hypothetical protein
VFDHYSDLDMAVHYDGEVPGEEMLAAIREGHGAPERAWLLGERAGGNIVEAYELDGVQAQIVHATIAAWENDIAQVLGDGMPIRRCTRRCRERSSALPYMEKR